MPEITETGVKVTTQSEYLDQLEEMHLSINPEWAIDSNSPDGQRNILESRMLWELEQQAVSVRASIDPRQAKKAAVDDIAALFDTERAIERQSTVDFDLVGNYGVLVKSGSQIRNKQTGEVWSLDDDTTIPNKGSFTSIDYGAITITGEFIPNTIIENWRGVENPTNFIIGREQETDSELEDKRKSKILISSIGMRGSIKAAILALDNVNSAEVIENEEDTEVNGQAPNSVHCVVSGGDEIEICTAIDDKISIGCKTVGSIEHLITTELDKYGMKRRFDRPTFINVSVRYSIKGFDELLEEDLLLVPEYVVKYANGQIDLPLNENQGGFKLGQSPSADLLSTPLNLALGNSFAENGNIYTDKIEFSSDGGLTWVEKVLPIGRLEQAVFSEDRVILQGALL